MNQYEIELRDKFAQIALVQMIKENSAQAFKLNVDAISRHSYIWANKLMEERQKHLNAINEAKPPALETPVPSSLGIYRSSDIYGSSETGHKVQGTECDR